MSTSNFFTENSGLKKTTYTPLKTVLPILQHYCRLQMVLIKLKPFSTSPSILGKKTQIANVSRNLTVLVSPTLVISAILALWAVLAFNCFWLVWLFWHFSIDNFGFFWVLFLGVFGFLGLFLGFLTFSWFFFGKSGYIGLLGVSH